MCNLKSSFINLLLLLSQIKFTVAFQSSVNMIRLRTALNVLSSPSPRQRSTNIDKGMFRNTSSKPSPSGSSTNVLKPLIICGPSGVGKGTVIGRFMEEMNGAEKFSFTVSHTTRAPRPGEQDGVHYHFTTVPEIKEAISKQEFLEFAEVHGNWYGTSLKSLQTVKDVHGKLPLLDIDVQGVKNVKAWQRNQSEGIENPNVDLPQLDAKYIFIAPPSVEALKQRLVGRGTETPETLERRTKNALEELRYGSEEGNFDAIVVNDDLDQACIDFKKAIEKLYDGDF